MIIQHNIMALNAHRQLSGNTSLVGKNIEKLSSGFKINRAGDDASGLAISEKMRAQIKGLEVAQKNAQDGISLIQTAEGALTEVHSMLNRMVELAEKSANGTVQNEVDRDAIQKEVKDLLTEIDRITKSTNFNGINLLDGSLTKYADATTPATNPVTVTGGNLELNHKINLTVAADKTVSLTSMDGGVDFSDTAGLAAAGITVIKDDSNPTAGVGTYKFTLSVDKSVSAENYEKYNGVSISMTTAADTAAGAVLFTVGERSDMTLQIGDSNDSFQKVEVQAENLSSAGLGLADLKVDTQEDAGKAIAKIKDAINKVSTNRANLGGLQNRLEHTVNNLAVTEENMTASESRIRDVDMAKEMMSFTKNNVLTQAAQAMLAQANTQPQSVLQLLQ